MPHNIIHETETLRERDKLMKFDRDLSRIDHDRWFA